MRYFFLKAEHVNIRKLQVYLNYLCNGSSTVGNLTCDDNGVCNQLTSSEMTAVSPFNELFGPYKIQ